MNEKRLMRTKALLGEDGVKNLQKLRQSKQIILKEQKWRKNVF